MLALVCVAMLLGAGTLLRAHPGVRLVSALSGRTPRAPTCTTTWTGASSDNWGTASNWSTKRLPGSRDWVCIPARAHNLPVVVLDTASVAGVTNSGALDVAVGPLDLTSTTVGSTSTGTLNSAGVVFVGHALTVSGSFTSIGGTMTGPGVVTVAKGATWNVRGGTIIADRVLSGGSVVIPAAGSVTVATGGSLDNLGSLTVGAGAGIYGSCTGHATTGGIVVNAGTLSFAPGTGNLAYLGDVEQALSCLLVHNEKALVVASGEAIVEQNAVLDLSKGSVVSGTGELEVGAPSGRYSNGTLNVNTSLSVPTLAVDSGVVQGPGSLSVATALTTAGGLLAGPGSVTVAHGAKWTASAGTIGTHVINDGVATVPAGGDVFLRTGGTLTNTANFSVGAARLDGVCQGGAAQGGVFVNTGTLAIEPGNGFDSSFGDTIEPGENCLTVRNEHALVLGSGTALIYQNAALELDTGTAVSGSGTLQIGLSGVTYGGTLNVNKASRIGSLSVESGAVTGPGALTISHTLTVTSTRLTSGTLAGPGTVTIAKGASWSVGSTTLGTNVVNEGNMTLLASSTLTVGLGQTPDTLTNDGTLSIGSGQVDVTSLSSLDNAKTVSVGQDGAIIGTCLAHSTIPGVVTNTGQLVFSPGIGQLAYLGDTRSPSPCLDVQNKGAITVGLDGTAVVEQASLDLEAGSTETGAGTLTIGGSMPATLNVTAATTVYNLEVDSGSVAGSGNLTVAGALTTGAGASFAGPGSVTIASGGSWAASSGTVATSISNFGTATIAPGTTSFSGGGSLTNGANATLSVTAGALVSLGPGSTVVNAGTVTLGNNSAIDGSCASATPAATITNTGTLTFAPTTGSASLGEIQSGQCLAAESTGVLSVASGTALVQDASLGLGAGGTESGAGTLDIGSLATLSVSGPSVTANNLVVYGFAKPSGLDVSGALTVAGSLVTGNANVSGTGALTVGSNATWTVDDGGTLSTTMTNEGAAALPTGAILTIASGGVLTNTGSITMGNNSAIEGSCVASSSGGTLINDGTASGDGIVIAAGSGGSAYFGESQGQLTDACLEVSNAGNFYLESGTGVIEQKATLELNTGSAFAGSGVLDIDDSGATAEAGTLNVNTSGVTIPSLQLKGGSMNVNANANVSNLTWVSANITVAGATTLTVASLAALPSGGLMVAANNSGQFGQISVTDSSSTQVNVQGIALTVLLGLYVPTCGGNDKYPVEAVAAANISPNQFSSLTGTQVNGGTWSQQSGSDWIGAQLNC